MIRSALFVSGLAVAIAPIAGAAVIASSVATSLSLGNSVGSSVFAGTSSKSAGLTDMGTLLGTLGTNAGVRTLYQVNAVGAAGSGSHGGNVYAVTVTVGSITPGFRGWQSFYKSPIALSTDTISGAAISSATVSFGAGGGGLAFNDFGVGTTALAMETSQGNGDAAMKSNPSNFGYDPNASQYPSAGSINADGTLGFSLTYNASSLWNLGSNVSSDYAGNLAAYDINGFATTMYVEAYAPAPAPGAIALVGLAGLASRRRRA
jgi:MYXO-CTERM domain-containing protein